MEANQAERRQGRQGAHELRCNHCEFRDLISFPEAMMSNFVALIVEDDPFQRECLADLLKSEGLEVVECANGEVAELVLAKTGPELRALVTDVELAGKVSGVELAQYAKRKFPGLNVVMVSWTWPASRSARHPLSYEAL
jgi:CheY-like chemotaxis protein